jgi:DNA-binding HxlR family transcriptional regulator
MVMLGGAWAPNIIWYLSGGPRRFSELKIDIPGISAKVLSTRLKEMEEKGAIERRIVPTSPPSVEYRLSDLGEEFVPAKPTSRMSRRRCPPYSVATGRL